MADEHLQQAAVCLRAAEERWEGCLDGDLGMIAYTLEALVHAVLHLAEVMEVRETIGGER